MAFSINLKEKRLVLPCLAMALKNKYPYDPALDDLYLEPVRECKRAEIDYPYDPVLDELYIEPIKELKRVRPSTMYST